MIVKRALVGAAGLAVTAAGVLFAVPAQADVVPEGAGFVETKTTEDDGRVPYTISVDWNYLYKDPAGTLRASVNPLKVKRSDADILAAGQPEDAGLDIHFDVINPSGNIIQHVIRDNVDLDFAADNQASFNPRNPKSGAGAARIRVRVGTDGDGLGSSDWVYFVQPAGIGPKPSI